MALRKVSNEMFASPIKGKVNTYKFVETNEISVTSIHSSAGAAGHVFSSSQSVELPEKGLIGMAVNGKFAGTGTSGCWIGFGLYDGTNWAWPELYDNNGNISLSNGTSNLKSNNSGAVWDIYAHSTFMSIERCLLQGGTTLNLQPAAIRQSFSVDNGIIKGQPDFTTEFYLTVFDFS